MIVYLVMETTHNDTTVMCVFANKEDAYAKRDKYAADFPNIQYWVDSLRVQ